MMRSHNLFKKCGIATDTPWYPIIMSVLRSLSVQNNQEYVVGWCDYSSVIFYLCRPLPVMAIAFVFATRVIGPWSRFARRGKNPRTHVGLRKELKSLPNIEFHATKNKVTRCDPLVEDHWIGTQGNMPPINKFYSSQPPELNSANIIHTTLNKTK